jgi:serine protease Do
MSTYFRRLRKLGDIATVLLSLLTIVFVSGCEAKDSMTSSPIAQYTVQAGPIVSFSSMIGKVRPSIAYVYVETSENDSSGNPLASIGSGVILRSDGWILTNRHVLEGYKTIQVTLYNRRTYIPSKVLMDDTTDLAVMKIEVQGLPALPQGNADSVAVGDWVLAIGHALGISPLEGGPTVSEGLVSSLGRSFTMNDMPYYDLIQTSAAINPGNSGGALVNAAGEMIGINSAGVPSAQGIGYAISIGTASHVFNDLVQYGKPLHPYLGVRISDVSAEAVRKYHVPFESAVVDSVDPGSPAEAAGLRIGDAITGLFGENVTSAADLMKVLWRHNPGDQSSIVFLHRGIENRKDIKLADKPQTNSM